MTAKPSAATHLEAVRRRILTEGGVREVKWVARFAAFSLPSFFAKKKKRQQIGRKEWMTVSCWLCAGLQYLLILHSNFDSCQVNRKSHTYEQNRISKRSIDFIGYSFEWFRTKYIFFPLPSLAIQDLSCFKRRSEARKWGRQLFKATFKRHMCLY